MAPFRLTSQNPFFPYPTTTCLYSGMKQHFLQAERLKNQFKIMSCPTVVSTVWVQYCSTKKYWLHNASMVLAFVTRIGKKVKENSQIRDFRALQSQ